MKPPIETLKGTLVNGYGNTLNHRPLTVASTTVRTRTTTSTETDTTVGGYGSNALVSSLRFVPRQSEND